MTTAIKHAPQLRFGEQLLEDATLEQMLEERATAQVALENAKGYVDDYLDQLDLEGEYRVGRFRVKVGSRRTLSVTVPKK